MFSVLDAKSGFLQIARDEASSLLTIFNTPIGRFRWLRLPFGLKCPPENVQHIMDSMLEGISGAVSVMDDILIAVPTVKEHDVILHQVVERATSYNLKLNFDKCYIRQASVSYDNGRGSEPTQQKVKQCRRRQIKKESTIFSALLLTCLNSYRTSVKWMLHCASSSRAMLNCQHSSSRSTNSRTCAHIL